MPTNTTQLTAGEVMDKAAALYNDAGKQVVYYEVQLPYLNLALQDLRKKMELNNSPVTNSTTSDPIYVAAGVTRIGFTTPMPARLPNDLIEIQTLWQREAGVNPYTEMSPRLDFLPKYLEGVESNFWNIWAWEGNEIRLPAANQDNELKIDYVRSLFMNVTSENDQLSVINADSYLEFRTAALLAEFVGENATRAISLNGQAELAWDLMSGIETKGKQEIYTRRRPFRAAWKNRTTY